MNWRANLLHGRLSIVLPIILLACSIGLAIVFTMLNSFDVLARRSLRVEQAVSAVRAIAEVHDMRASALRATFEPSPQTYRLAREKFDLLHSRLTAFGTGSPAVVLRASPLADEQFQVIMRSLAKADALLNTMSVGAPVPEFEEAIVGLVPQLELFGAFMRDHLIEDSQKHSSELRQLLNWQITLTVVTFGSVIVAFFLSLFQNRHLERINALISESSERYQDLANHDALTGLPNRRHMQHLVETMCAQGRYTFNRIAVACLDIDRFKQINDTLGHFAGDELVVQFAERLKESIPPGMSTAVGRQGGDEFVFAMVYDENQFDSHTFFTQLQGVLSSQYKLENHAVMVGASIGLTIESIVAADWIRLLTQADIALKNAKERGRGQLAVYEDGMVEDVIDRHQLEQDLCCALDANQFELHYQPIVALHSAAPVAFEALLRWQHPVHGMVSPARFIPIAEETGLIVDIGAWVIRQACRTAATLPADIRISVNISAVQMLRSNVAETIRAALAEHKLPGRRLVVELTESVMLNNEQRFAEMFAELKNLGVGLALDDFGTGFSSMSYLRRYKFERLKVDRSFVADVERNSEARLLVKYMIDLGRALAMSVIAEGVETAGQALLLTADGCDAAQGYYFARPQPIRTFYKGGQWASELPGAHAGSDAVVSAPHKAVA
ncbi:MAG: putative bifunctional diguanylate cyclase/phosphodiesterase [Beijerinckiaceae bacterium]